MRPLCSTNATPVQYSHFSCSRPCLYATASSSQRSVSDAQDCYSCSVPFTVSLLPLPFGEIALIPCASNRDFPNSCLWLLLPPLSSHIPQASVFKIRSSRYCAKTLKYRHLRSVYQLALGSCSKYNHPPTHVRVAFRGTLRKLNIRKSEFP